MPVYYIDPLILPFPTTIPVHTGDRLSQSIITAFGRQVGSVVDRPVVIPEMVGPLVGSPLFVQNLNYQIRNPA